MNHIARSSLSHRSPLPKGEFASSVLPWGSLLLVGFMLAGCGGGTEPDGPAPAADTPGQEGDLLLTARSARGNFTIQVRPDGGSIPLNEPFAVTLDVSDPETGEALEDLSAVTLDARMPAHGHGMLRDVELVPTDSGSLRAEGLLFHMIGHWEFHVDVTRGPRVERAQVSFELSL